MRQEIYRKQGYAVQADEEQLRVQMEALQAELNAPTQFKVSHGKHTHWDYYIRLQSLGLVTHLFKRRPK